MAPKPTAALAVLYFLAVLSTTAAQPEPAAPKKHLRALALADISHSTKKENKKAEADQRDPLPAGWFGDFSQGESTYTTEGKDSSKDDPAYNTKYGKDPSVEGPYDNQQVMQPSWFHESQSGGYLEAWQSDSPAVTGSFAGNRAASENHWRNTPSGWRQDYRPMRLNAQGEGQLHADFFDNSVRNIDGFGRQKAPSAQDGEDYNRDLMRMWKERSVNTTITCAEPGCTGRASINLYNTKSEEAKLCSLSVHLHPTDYDDDWSREHVEFMKVNDYVVTRECNPKARGCNATAELPLYPCVNNFNVDKLVDSAGTLVVEAKNSIMVDECPYQSNLLSGIIMTTCMVRLKKPVPPPPALLAQNQKCEEIVKCNTPGCTGETLIPCSPALALNGGTCKMNISVAQTDYDDALGLPEDVEFFQVEGTNVTTGSVSPGKNPCNAQYKDTPLAEDQLWFSAVSNYDVTELMKKSKPLGWVRVTGKNSPQVDECAYKNNLLYSKVSIICEPPTKAGNVANFIALPPGGIDVVPTMMEAPAKAYHGAPGVAPTAEALVQEKMRKNAGIKRPSLMQKSVRAHQRKLAESK